MFQRAGFEYPTQTLSEVLMLLLNLFVTRHPSDTVSWPKKRLWLKHGVPMDNIHQDGSGFISNLPLISIFWNIFCWTIPRPAFEPLLKISDSSASRKKTKGVLALRCPACRGRRTIDGCNKAPQPVIVLVIWVSWMCLRMGYISQNWNFDGE